VPTRPMVNHQSAMASESPAPQDSMATTESTQPTPQPPQPLDNSL